MYYTLFNGMTDALEELEQQNFGSAKTLLIKAQQRAEEAYLETEDECRETEQADPTTGETQPEGEETQPDMEDAPLAAEG